MSIQIKAIERDYPWWYTPELWEQYVSILVERKRLYDEMMWLMLKTEEK